MNVFGCYTITWFCFSLTASRFLSRNAIELKGGLCGLSALYWALTDTILTASQLTRFLVLEEEKNHWNSVYRMDHNDMRAAIEDIMGSNSTEGDQILLEEFSNCKSDGNSHKLNHPITVICGNLSTMPTKEVFLEDWLILNNSTSTERTGKRRKKRQVEAGSTMIAEEYRHGTILTYTCGIARQFKNSTGLYNERWHNYRAVRHYFLAKLKVFWVPVEQEVVTCYRVGPLPLGAMYQPSTAPWASQSCLRLPGGEDCKSSFQNILMFLKQEGSNIISSKNYSPGATWVPRQCELQLQLKWGVLWTWSRGSRLQHLMSRGECFRCFLTF